MGISFGKIAMRIQREKKGMILGSGCLNNCYGVGDSRVFWLIGRFEMGFMVNARRIERKVLFFF